MKYLTALISLLALAAVGRADFVTELWGNDPLCHHQETLKVDSGVAAFDLSALPKNAQIQRAVLRVKLQRTDFSTTIAIYPLAKDQEQAPADAKMLPLAPPWYATFDATGPLREWARTAEGPFRLHFKTVPGWRSQSTMLEVAYSGAAGEATPGVSGLRAVCHDGQTFLTWKEHEDILEGVEPITIENMEKKLLPLRGKTDFVYRVYAADKPITAQTLAQAALLAEVPFVLSMYYLDSINTIEHPNPVNGEGATPLIAGARAKRQNVPAYVIAKGEQPLPRGSGLYVRTITQPGKTYYAVVTAVNGREAVAADGLKEGLNTLKDAVEEQKAPPIPVLQSSRILKGDNKNAPGWVVSTFNYWLEFPYANIPRQLAVATRNVESMPTGKKLALCVQLGAYGSQPAFNAGQRGGGEVTLCPPWDMDDSILQGRHECMDTLRSYSQGVVHPWAQRRTMALVDWAKRDFPVDPENVSLVGQFGLWGLRHADVFAIVHSDAYGNFNKGREAQKHGRSWGPYPKGSLTCDGIDQWDAMNVSKWVRENPKLELPYLVLRPTSSSHVGDMNPWAWPELYRALHDTKRAFTARNGGVWSGQPAAAGVMADKIRLHQSLPAFGHCSLDGMPGDGEMTGGGGVGQDCDVVGDLNGYLLWETQDIVDEPGKWEMTVYLYGGDARYNKSDAAPAEACSVDLTPRRCQKFTARPGEKFNWSNTSLKDNQTVAGTATADKNGFVTIEKLTVTKDKNWIKIWK